VRKFFGFLWRYKIYTIIGLIILAVIGGSIWKKNNSGVEYVYDKATFADVSDLVSETGNLQLEGQASITSPIEGVVNQIFVKNGERVGSGETLFSVKSNATEIEKAAAYATLLTAQSNLKIASQANGTHQAAVETARAAYLSAQVNHHNVSLWFARGYKNVATDRHYTQQEIDSAKATMDAAEQGLANAEQALADTTISVEAAQATLDSAQESYDSKTIYTVKASRAGTVYNISINVGDKMSVTAATPAAIIAGSDQIAFKAQINENDVAKLKLDQVADISVDAIKNKVFKGKVGNIDTIGTNTSGVITFNVYFSIDESDEAMRSGMSGSVNVVVDEHKNVLTVANAAVKPYQNGKAVQVVDTSKPKTGKTPALKYVPIKIGIRGADRTEVTEGLTEGMGVVVNSGTNQFKSNLFGG